jgi:hypothetical protein
VGSPFDAEAHNILPLYRANCAGVFEGLQGETRVGGTDQPCEGRRYLRRLAVLGALAFSLASCQAIQPVAFEPFADGQDSVLVEPMTYSIENTGEVIVVPAGFVTDFASTPRAIWAVLPPFGTYQKASVIHDYLYWMHECTKDQADKFYLSL